MNDQANKAEAFSTAVFLTLSGGFQDAYTYLTRDKVFANGQTGNIVLLAKNLAESEWSVALGYAIPVFSFIIGIYVAEVLKTHFSTLKRFHWSQLVLMIEISILFAVGFISHGHTIFQSFFRVFEIHRLAIEDDLPFILCINAEQTFHHCGFPCTILTHKTANGSFGNGKIDAIKHFVFRECFRQVPYLKHYVVHMNPFSNCHTHSI